MTSVKLINHSSSTADWNNLQTYEKKWNPMSSFSKKMVKNVFNDEVFNLVFVYFFFSVVCECV